MSDNNGDFGAFITGFVIGGLVGAAVSLLLAPQSGEETRTLIRDKSIEIRDQVEQSADDARKRAEQLAADAKSKAEDLQKRGQVVLEEQKTRIEKAVEAGKKATQRKKSDETDEEAA
jgi:gas vesicle protein